MNAAQAINYGGAGPVRPRSIIRRDPRRRGRRAMLAVWCWCSRFYTITPEAAARATGNPCPSCGDAS